MLKKDRVLKIDELRLFSDIEELGEIGLAERGRTRIALSDSDAEARRWFVRKLEEIGARVMIDRFGNIAGVVDGKSDEIVAVGSHLDSVMEAGNLDGAYGVLGGLAILRSIVESKAFLKKSVAVMNFTNEEGVRFQPDMMGSLAISGLVHPDKILAAVDDDGISVRDELLRIGFSGSDSFRPSRYLELHIEQGPVLEEGRKRLGVVSGIQGIAWWRVRFTGQPCHAGAFPMRLRKDPFAALADFSGHLRACVAEYPLAVGTIGSVRLFPNLINVIPGEIEFTVDARCPDDFEFSKLKDKVEELLLDCAARNGIGIELECVADAPAIKFPSEMTSLIEECASEETDLIMKLVSGAGHDAQFMHFICPSAMIFIPSKGGLSHCPDEYSAPDDIVLGVNVLARAVARLADITIRSEGE